MKVSILLEALTGRFETDTKRAASRFSRDMKKMERDAQRFGKALGVATTAAIVAGVAIVKSQASQIDALAKTADALDVSTESLQALHTMSELAGISSDDLDKKLGRMQKNLGEIARRGGTMAEALADAGLKIEDVINLPADRQFEEIAKALAKVKNQTLRVSIASDLFGRDANKLLALTDQLAKEGLAGMTAELEKMGGLISRSEAAGVERMNDSVEMALKVTKAMAQRFTVELAPAIAAIAEEFLEAAKQSGGFQKEVTSGAGIVVDSLLWIIDAATWISRAFKVVAREGIVAFEFIKLAAFESADYIINGPNRAVNALLRLLDQVPGVNIDFRFGDVIQLQHDAELSKSIIQQALADIDAIIAAPMPSDAIRARMAAIQEALAGVGAAGSAGGGISPEEEKRIKSVNDMLAGLLQQVREFGATDSEKALLRLVDLGADESQIAQAMQLMDELRILNEEQDRREEADKARNDLMSEYASLVQSLQTPVEAHAAQVQRIVELYNAGIIPSVGEYEQALARLNERFVETNKKVSEMDEFGKEAARNIQSAMADFLFDPFDEGLAGMAKSFAMTLQRMAAEAAAAAILKKLFGGDGATGVFGSSGFGGFISGIFGGTMDSGGRGVAGQAYLINPKAGPELFIPDSAGTFIPNADKKTGGGTTIYNTTNLPPSYSRQSASQIAQENAFRLRRAAARNG